MNTNIPGLAKLIGNSPSFLLAIMWKDENDNTFRYALWNDVGEVIDFTLPLYAGQLIKANFRLEAWSISGQAIALNTLNLAFLTSVLQGLDYRYSQDTPLKNADPIVTNFGCPINAPAGQFPNGILSIQSHFVASDGFIGAPPTIWQDRINSQLNLSSVSEDQNMQSVNVTTLNVPTVTACDFSYSGAVFSYNPAHSFYLINFTGNTTADSQFYLYQGDTNISCSISPSDSTHVLLTLEDSSTLVVPINKWIILDICYNLGKSRVTYYNLYTQSPTPQPYPTGFNNTASVTAGARYELTYSGLQPFENVVFFYLAEIVIFNTYIGITNTQLLLNYFNAQYNFLFPVPLVFPTNSSPLPNP